MAHTNAKKIYDLVGAEALLTEAEDLRRYLTGFSSSFGYVLSDKDGSVFYTDPRYLEAAEKELKGSEISVEKYTSNFNDLLTKYKQIAIPVDRTLYSDYKKLQDSGLEIIDSSSAFIRAMSVKEDYEIESIKKACQIADKAFLKLLSQIKEGMTENDVAALLEFLMRDGGASGTSFDIIVCFGESSSVPHHDTGMRKLKFGDIILIDFGCKYNGYCSDCTRTFLFGDDGKKGEFKSSYLKVLEAHMLVKEQLKAGMGGAEVDAIARNCLKNYGLDKLFTHSLGHGIGLNIHEFPRISPKSEDIIVDGMVFSDEPGVYLSGEYGIRIEDTVMLEKGKAVSLTDTDKKLIIL